MKKIIQIYKKDQKHIVGHIRGMVSSLPKDFLKESRSIFKKHRYIDMIYSVDSEYKQNSPSIHRHKVTNDSLGSDKSQYFSNINLKHNDVFISSPYIHQTSGKPSISVVYRVGDIYYVMDINMMYLLEELRLIEYNSFHEKVIKSVYIFGSSVLGLVAFTLIGYGAYILISVLLSLSVNDFLHDVFNSIVAVTIGLAMFDLSRQIMEHEVLFKSFHKEEDREFKMLGKFLISIIIALSIETLMVVFKIVLDDYRNMISAFYLLLGTTIMFVGLAYFKQSIKTTHEAEIEEE
ncbi:MAG TPA: hypothetical protein PLM93_00470 [Sulfuricurvum sp.]|nr:MAG: hypothetical protein B7Y30_04265 [Campylobacterales bacterium 16-40-21]OZA03836.1 MAG: hypothetical protein B7X89_03960 [Sulfuricurvum sp. 17-40-25]HQS65644.1 hypothetical protein [Sulfuricurvum sp.]HQT36150.1 hypothetical protein [Sulfuricurvum sp.]